MDLEGIRHIDRIVKSNRRSRNISSFLSGSRKQLIIDAINKPTDGTIRKTKYLEDTVYVGSVDSPESVLSGSGNCFIALDANPLDEGPVIFSAQSILSAAKNSGIILNVKEDRTVLGKDIESLGDILSDSKYCYIRGDNDISSAEDHQFNEVCVNSQGDILKNSKSCNVKANLHAMGSILQRAKKCHVKGQVVSFENVLSSADAPVGILKNDFTDSIYCIEDSSIEGRVQANDHILYGADNCFIRNSRSVVTTHGTILSNSTLSYIITESLYTKKLGLGSSGCIVAAKDLIVKEIDPNLIVFTQQEGIENTIQYTGDWSYLEKVIIDGDFRRYALLFDIPKEEIQNEVKLRAFFKNLKRISGQIKEETELYLGLVDILGLGSLTGTNEEKFERIKDIQSELLDVLERRKEEFDGSDSSPSKFNYESLRYIVESGNTYLLDNLDSIEEVEEINNFIRIFSNKESRKEYIPDESFSASFEVDNQRTYQEGINFITDLFESEDSLDIQEVLEKTGFDFEQTSLEALKDTLKELKEFLDLHPNTINQSYQIEWLLKNIEIDTKYSNIDRIQFNLYDKNLDKIPTYKKYGCCTFLEGTEEDIFGYLMDKDVQLMEIGIGSQPVMAIMVDSYDPSAFRSRRHLHDNGELDYVERTYDRILLIDSVESNSRILSSKNISSVVVEGIENYAREKGYKKIFYLHSDWSNRSYNDFISLISHEDVNSDKYKYVVFTEDQELLKLSNIGPNVFSEESDVILEANFGGKIHGFMKTLDD